MATGDYLATSYFSTRDIINELGRYKTRVGLERILSKNYTLTITLSEKQENKPQFLKRFYSCQYIDVEEFKATFCAIEPTNHSQTAEQSNGDDTKCETPFNTFKRRLVSYIKKKIDGPITDDPLLTFEKIKLAAAILQHIAPPTTEENANQGEISQILFLSSIAASESTKQRIQQIPSEGDENVSVNYGKPRPFVDLKLADSSYNDAYLVATLIDYAFFGEHIYPAGKLGEILITFLYETDPEFKTRWDSDQMIEDRINSEQ